MAARTRAPSLCASTNARAPDGAPVHCDRRRPVLSTKYRLVQQHAASFIARNGARIGSELPRFTATEPRHKQSGALLVTGVELGHWPGPDGKVEFDASLQALRAATFTARAESDARSP